MKGILFSFFAALLFSHLTAQINITVGPYLQSPTPTSIKVMWRTDSTSSATVKYGTDPGNLTLSATDPTVTDKHTVSISGLNPFTTYYYAAYNDSIFVEGGDTIHKFKTFPTSTDPGHVRAWCIGDFGKGNTKESQVRDSYPFDSIETNLWLWLGDNVYDNGTEEEYVTKVFDSIYGYKKLMKGLPFHPCPGNHDYGVISPPQSTVNPPSHTGPYYDFVDVYTGGESGGVASNYELYYSFDYRNVHFISLNSELGSLTTPSHNWTGASIPFILPNNFTSSQMSQWLEQDLTANTKPWVVVYFHQPPYTDGSHKSSDLYEAYMRGMRENYCPIFEQYGVDIVLCGHSHVYERSYLVKGSYGEDANINTSTMILQNKSGVLANGEAYTKSMVGANPNQGTVYVVTGNSGSNESSPDFNHPYMYSEYGCDTCIGSFILDVEGAQLDGRFLDAYGNVRDHFTILKTLNSGVNEMSASPITDLFVVPNPFSNVTKLSFILNASEKVNLFLTDLHGRVIEVAQQFMMSGSHEVEIDAKKLNLSKGVYNLSIKTTSGETSRKIVLQ